jgi:hypothetical protein
LPRPGSGIFGDGATSVLQNDTHVYAAGGELNVVLNNNVQNAMLQIFDVAGKCVFASTKVSGKQIPVNVSVLAPGLYTLRILNQEGASLQRFIKQ